jgi:hypothetical protein
MSLNSGMANSGNATYKERPGLTLATKLGTEPGGPQRSHQLILADEAAAVLDERS